MNQELINSAVGFLKDPNVNSAPLTKKVEFLESKGLNQQEIEEALRRANGETNVGSPSGTSSGSSTQSVAPYSQQAASVPSDYYNYAPPVPERSWKDYFIMATATAGVTYGLYQVVSKYLVPSLIPPSQSSIDADKEKIDDEFVKIDKLLEQLAQDQTEIKESNEAKAKEIDTVINNVNDFLAKYNKDKLTFDDDLRLMKLEVENLRNSIEKNMGTTKENIKQELEDIGEELESLKQLVQARAGKVGSLAESVPRKIAPVSSIPSASEILKKAKAAKAASASPEMKSAEVKSEVKPAEPKKIVLESLSGALQHTPEVVDASEVEDVNPSGSLPVSNGGVPQWQLQQNATEKTQNGIPAWQQNSGISSWQEAQSNNEKKAAEAIEANGLPAWQLNASN